MKFCIDMMREKIALRFHFIEPLKIDWNLNFKSLKNLEEAKILYKDREFLYLNEII